MGFRQASQVKERVQKDRVKLLKLKDNICDFQLNVIIIIILF